MKTKREPFKHLSRTQTSTLPATLTMPTELVESTASRTPAAVYLARLAPGPRRTMQEALNTIATLLGQHDAETCPWSSLRYAHTQAIRAKLAERYSAATTNKMLAALRGVLREAWRLGQVNAEDFHRAEKAKRKAAELLLVPFVASV